MVRLTTNPFRILIVDDDPMTCRTLRAVAERNGISVTSFSDVRHAYRDVPKMKFDLAIVDYNLGLVTGTQLSNYLMNYGNTTPVLFISGSGAIDSSKWAPQVVASVGKKEGPLNVIDHVLRILSK